MAGNGDIMDGIEPCRTCGIFYLTTSNFLRQIFDSSTDDYDLSPIRIELATWNIELSADDGLPMYICTCCILEFQKLFKFRGLCVELQAQWKHFYNIRKENNVYIKKEIPDPDEKPENICDFIYVDDVSENEMNGGGTGNFEPFSMPHVPIKEEFTEDPPVHNEDFVSTLKESFNSSNQMEISGDIYETDNININYLANSNLNILDTSELQHLEEPVDNGGFESIQNISTSVPCSLCRHISATSELHGQHMQRIHEIKDMVCHICGKQFQNSTANRLKFHLKWHRISKHIKCAQCGFFCDSRETLKEHARGTHTKIECITCGKRVLCKKMKNHMHTHELRSWPCSYCDEVFKNESILEAHIWQIHAQEETVPIATEENYLLREEQVFSCSQCDQIYPNQEELNAHKTQCILKQDTIDTESFAKEDIQSEQFQYQDPADDSKKANTNTQTIDQSIIVKEESLHHSGNNTITQVISSDDESCVSESHSEVLKELACPKCTKTFSSSEKLCMHYQQHLEKPGFSCHICGKSFELKFTLNRHITKHKNP